MTTEVRRSATDAVRVDLTALVNNQGITRPDTLRQGAFNVWGNSFSAAAVPAAGTVADVDGVPFTFPVAAGDGPDNIRCEGQYIALPGGDYDWIHVLAAAERRAEDRVQLHFAGGAVDPESLRISDFWAAPPVFGETAVVDWPVMHYPHHVQSRVSACLWHQRVPVTRRQRLVGIRLPRLVAIHVFAMTLVPRPGRSDHACVRDGADLVPGPDQLPAGHGRDGVAAAWPGPAGRARGRLGLL